MVKCNYDKGYTENEEISKNTQGELKMERIQVTTRDCYKTFQPCKTYTPSLKAQGIPRLYIERNEDATYDAIRVLLCSKCVHGVEFKKKVVATIDDNGKHYFSSKNSHFLDNSGKKLHENKRILCPTCRLGKKQGELPFPKQSVEEIKTIDKRLTTTEKQIRKLFANMRVVLDKLGLIEVLVEKD